MNIIYATSPADFPAMCIMMSKTGFIVRISEGNSIQMIDLPNEFTLSGAVQAADQMGYRCDHWCDVRGNTAVVRHL